MENDVNCEEMGDAIEVFLALLCWALGEMRSARRVRILGCGSSGERCGSGGNGTRFGGLSDPFRSLQGLLCAECHRASPQRGRPS